MDAELGLLQPWWLLLLPLPWLWLRWRRHRQQAWPSLLPRLTVHYPPLSHLPEEQPQTSVRSPGQWSDRLTAMALTLLLFALAQPVQYTRPIATQRASEPVDLILVVGTAISMTLRDYVIDGEPVDRMRLARTLVDGFVKNYSGRRIGLVILGNPPALWLPLTTDRMVVRDAVARIRSVLGGRLTDMGATLKLVREEFAGPGEKVVVMVTDGGLQLGEVSPREAARALPAEGFSLYVIAMGAQGGNAVSSQQGGLIYEPTDLDTLQQIARLGGGSMFPAQDEHAFRQALQRIQRSHRAPLPPSTPQRLRSAWYSLPLALAMLLLLSAAFLPREGFRKGTVE